MELQYRVSRMRYIPLVLLVACSPAQPVPVSATAEPVAEYDRREWGSWRDEDRDCQDTRQEVLIRQSEIAVTFKDGKTCKVATGKWTCPYTGTEFTDPRGMDIDHMVPIHEAHVSGGWQWDRDKKRTYYNDLTPGHLVATSASSNRSKGSRDPAVWMPPLEGMRCSYLKAWVGVKKKWELEMDCGESDYMVVPLASCSD